MDSPRKTLEEAGGQEAGEDLSICANSVAAEAGAGAGDFLARETHMKDQNFVPAQGTVDAEATLAARLNEDANANAAGTSVLNDDFVAHGDSLAAGDNITVATEATLKQKIAARDQVLIAAQPNEASDTPETRATVPEARNFIIPQTPEAVRNLIVTTIPLSAEASVTRKRKIDFIAAKAKRAVRHKKCAAARTRIATAKVDTASGPSVVAGGNEAPAVPRATVASKAPVAGTDSAAATFNTTIGAPVAAQPLVTAAGDVLSPVRVGPSVATVVQASATATDRSFLLNEASMDNSSSIAAAALVIADLLTTVKDPIRMEVSVTAGGAVVACGAVLSRNVAAHEPPAEAPEATVAAPQAWFRAPEPPGYAREAPAAADASGSGEDSTTADDSTNAEDTNDDNAVPPIYDLRSDPLVNFLNGTIMVRYGDCLFVGTLKGFSQTHIIITRAAFYVNTTHLGNLTNHKLERRFIWKITCARPPYKVTYPRIDPN